MSEPTRVLITGAGGFIGHHLTKYLVDRGYWVRGVDIKEPEYEPTAANEFMLLDLSVADNCLKATKGVDEVYGLAANMGGIGFILLVRTARERPVRIDAMMMAARRRFRGRRAREES